MIPQKIKTFLPLILTIILLIGNYKKGLSQNIDLKAGFGNYEAFNIGLRHTYKHWNIEYGYGNDLNVYNQGFFNVIHFGAGMPILKKQISDKHKLFVQVKTFIWNIENQSNIFSAVSISSEILYKRKLNKNYQLGIYSGIIWSSVFRYKRKNYQDIGFPKEWQPNFGLSLYYRLK